MKNQSQTEIENLLIGAILAGDEMFDNFNSSIELGVTTDSFESHNNVEVWGAMTRIKDRDELLEEANIVVELSKNPKNQIDLGFLLQYPTTSPSQWKSSANGLVRNQRLRSVSRSLRIGLESIDDGDDPEKVTASVLSALENVDEVGKEDLSMQDIADLVYGNLLDENQPDKFYLPTGLTEYDSMLKGHGYGEGQLVVWAARPSLGKTTVVMNAALHGARMGHSIGIFSLEMAEEELGEKLAAMDCQIPVKVFEDKVANVEQKEKLYKSLKRIGKLPLKIDCKSRSLLQICIKAKQWVRKNSVKMIIIDYCQLIRGDRKLPREQQIAEISRELKLLASDLKIPVILVAQLNRETEKLDRRPVMSDLRESGALEQDANIITFLWLKSEDTVQGSPPYVRWYCAKQRAGEQHREGVFEFKRNLGIFTSYQNNPDLLP